MKEYYYLFGKEQKGPFTIEELETKGLTSETLFWYDGMENWQKLKDIPELFQQLNPKSTPPPPPNDVEEKITKTEVSGQLRVTTEKTPNPVLEVFKPSKKDLTWLIIWCAFHLFALLMSYSRVDFFSDESSPRKNKFWPFVEFTEDYVASGYDNQKVMKTEFNGIFVQYDWTEFALYVGGAIIIFLLVKISNKNNETTL